MRCTKVVGLAIVGIIGWATPVSAEARPLTMRAAERAIDLAYHAELAGDAAGGGAALRARLAEAKALEDTSGRERIESWLGKMADRTDAFRLHGKTAQGYAVAFRTLDGFGLQRATLLWRRAVRDVPGIESEVGPVALVTDRVVGIAKDVPVQARIAALIEHHGLQVDAVQKGSLVVQLDLDATESKKVGRRMRVVCKSSFVVKDRAREAAMVGSYSKRRTETRRKVEDARRFAVRRAMDDAAQNVVFFARLAALDRRAARPSL